MYGQPQEQASQILYDKYGIAQPHMWNHMALRAKSLEVTSHSRQKLADLTTANTSFFSKLSPNPNYQVIATYRLILSRATRHTSSDVETPKLGASILKGLRGST